MKSKLRYLGLLVILPLLTVALTSDFISADAQKAEGSLGHASPKSYGIATSDIVCGDKLCSELGSGSEESVG